MATGRGRGTATLIAALVVVAWLVVGAVAGPYSGRLGEVATNDNAAFLPADAEATRAQDLAADFADRRITPALVVYERATGITEADGRRVAADAARFAGVRGVVPPIPPPIPSRDGQALQVVVPIDDAEGERIGRVVDDLRTVAGADSGGLAVHVTGPAGLLADLIEVFRAIDGPLLLVTLLVVLVILLVVYRSPVLWIFPLLAAGMSYALAALLVYVLADADLVTLNGQAQGILTVLVFGAGTDYALLLIARHREELHRHRRPWDAMRAAWKGAAPAIIGSGGTVIVSLLCLLLSSLNSNRALGPVAAVGIAATLLVMLTFLPALLLLGGRWAFWPAGRRRTGPTPRRARDLDPGGRLRRPPRPAGLAGHRRRAGRAHRRPDPVARHHPRPERRVHHAHRLRRRAGGDLPALPGRHGQPGHHLRQAGDGPAGRPGRRGGARVTSVRPVTGSGSAAPPEANAPPVVVDGRVQLEATLTDRPDSPGAERTVRRLREAVHRVPGADAVVGGFTAVNVDTADASARDRNVIIPAVLAVIAVVLALLLRALLAPVLLIATVVLSFLATLGLCGLIFRYALDYPGVDQSFPLFAFVFLVALGIDYNIFLMSRVREESVRRGTRPGVLAGLALTGGVITSAGIVLAATFSALAVLPLVVLVELGVAVAVGVLLDTVVVRSLLVPALSYDIGPPVWWPSRLGRTARRVARHAR
ncbi:MMPL family transporter [Micromonospora olivasterospora]|uniref:RND superfamily putative drug exporter n=1 Tax=Micromonospora olivasterospora TaxID=1880 RepID=A0A562I5Q0_MICOL|nr:MMPL family transporter [Micromonospora olivasterospora]TWH65953.1 RND superfamily putative drug exporter [Micromonospora olivasterospora]